MSNRIGLWGRELPILFVEGGSQSRQRRRYARTTAAAASCGRAAVGLPALAESHARPDQEILEIARLAKMNVGFELFALNLLDLRNVARFAQSDELFFAQVEHKMRAADLAAIQITHSHPFVARRAGCPARSIMPANSSSWGRTRAKQDARCKAQEPLRFCSRKKNAAGERPRCCGLVTAALSHRTKGASFVSSTPIFFPPLYSARFAQKGPTGGRITSCRTAGPSCPKPTRRR